MARSALLIAAIQNKVAVSAVGASALRGLRTEGVVAHAQRYLATMRLRRFSTSKAADFRSRLDEETLQLQRALPSGARFCGVARKALNLFLRDAAYNAFLRAHFGLAAADDWYEVPPDAVVAKGLQRYDRDHRLPAWRGVKHLTPAASAKYQRLAGTVACEEGIARVHLDTFLWIEGR